MFTHPVRPAAVHILRESLADDSFLHLPAGVWKKQRWFVGMQDESMQAISEIGTSVSECGSIWRQGLR